MIAQLVPLAEVDDDLVAGWRTLGGNAFHSPDAVLASRDLDGAGEVSLLVVDGPDLVLPIHRVAGMRKVRVPALSTWTHDYCYLGDPVVRAGREQQAWTAALSWLREHRPAPWLHLPRLAAHGPVFAGLLAALTATGLQAVPLGAHGRPVAHRRPEPTYLDGLVSGVHRKSFRRQRRVLERELGAPVTTVTSYDVEPLLRLEAAGWKAASALATVPGAAELARRLVGSGAAHVAELRAGERVVAAQLQLVGGGTSSCVKTAYDEQLRRHSPGLLLELDVLERFHDDLSVDVLDSCAAPGNPLAERLFPDRLPVVTLLVGLTAPGRAVARATPALAAGWSRLTGRPMEVP